jgi:hypothetical protein
METAFTKLRTIVAVTATIIVAAVTIQAVTPASDEPARMPGNMCPPVC